MIEALQTALVNGFIGTLGATTALFIFHLIRGV